MEKLLVDGLGYDKELNQYFTNCYAWSYSEICYDGDDFIGKAGITKEDVFTAMSQATPTRGKQLQTNPHFGFKSDRKYLPVGITQSDANQIVFKMDVFFKEDMKDMNWVYRDRKKIKEFGTEFYIGPKSIWIDTIKEKWNDSFIKAMNLVLGFSENKNLGDLQTLGSQGVVTEQISESLETNSKIRVIIPCGYGKGFLMYAGPHKWSNFTDKKTLIYYTHNIPATKQLALKHSEYAHGTMYQGQIKRYVICSETKNVKGQVEQGIVNISVSDNELDNVIRQHIKFTPRVAFYANKMSAGVFNKKFNQIANELGYNTNENVGRIIDESQEITGNKSSTKVQAISDPIDSPLVSFTATERRRGQDTNMRRIYNDDEEYFGVVAVEIFPSQTIQEGRSCPIHFKTVEVSFNHELMKAIKKNSVIETLFDENYSVEVRGRLLRGIVCLVKSIIEDKRNHPLLVTNYRSDAEDAIKMIQILKDFEIIPKDFKIIRAFREDGLDSAKQFNSEVKSIMVGTPWVITGIDAPKTDGFIPLYDMGSEITATQGVGRGQRKYQDKNLIVYIPVDPDSSEIPTMLRVANNFILGQNSHNFGKETVESEEKTVLGSTKKTSITSEIDKDINANENLRIYWDKVYEDLINNSIGRASDYRQTYDEEKIEQLYKRFENCPFSELNVSSHSHPIQIARDLGIHDGLIKKYNITLSYHINKTEEDFKRLLECTTKLESRKKPYGGILQTLYKTKDQFLIEKYTKHLVELRIRVYQQEDLQEFFNNLSSETYPNSKKGTDKEHNGKYRAVFHRGKDLWYDKIISKWGDKVPMDYLKDEDKLKRMKRSIDESTNYTDWYSKYAHQRRILKRLDSLHLLDSLEKSHNRSRLLLDVINKAKKFTTRKEFSEHYPDDFAWVCANGHKETVFSHMPLLNGWDKRNKGNV
jgi:superfamily II DNA or RNA helicase